MGRMKYCLWLISLMPAASLAGFQLVVTATAPGSNSDQGMWGGVLRYSFETDRSAGVQVSGIDASLVSDPSSVLFSTSGELFVGNRHGNSAASDISRFLYDSGSDSFVANGTISGNSLYGVHQTAFRTGTNELFATNLYGPISKFEVFPGDSLPLGVQGSGTLRGIAFNDDGTRMYTTSASNVLHTTNLATGDESDLTIDGAASIHYAKRVGQSLYLGDLGPGTVFRVDLDATGAPLTYSAVAQAPGAVAIDFSPDGQEMFVACHFTAEIRSFHNESGNWVLDNITPTGARGLGGIAVVTPEPASLAVMGLGIVGLLRLRRRSQLS